MGLHLESSIYQYEVMHCSRAELRLHLFYMLSVVWTIHCNTEHCFVLPTIINAQRGENYRISIQLFSVCYIGYPTQWLPIQCLLDIDRCRHRLNYYSHKPPTWRCPNHQLKKGLNILMAHERGADSTCFNIHQKQFALLHPRE